MAKIKLYEKKDGYTTTTDAGTQQTICTFDVSTGGPGGTALNNCSIFIHGSCAGYVSAGGNAAGESIVGLFKVVSGTLSQVSTDTHVVPMIKDTGGAPNSDFSVSGNVITYYVTGVAATTIDWFGVIDIVAYQTA